MTDLLHKIVHSHHEALSSRIEVLGTLESVIAKTEEESRNFDQNRAHKQLLSSARLTRHAYLEVKRLQEENDGLKKKISTIQDGALAVREKLAVDISRLLAQSKDAVKMKNAMKKLRQEVHQKNQNNSELRKKEGIMQDEIYALESAMTTLKSEHAKEIAALQEKIRNMETTKREEPRNKSSGEATLDEVDSFFSELQVNTEKDLPAHETVLPASPLATSKSAMDVNSTQKAKEGKNQAETAVGEAKKKHRCLLSDTEDLELLHVFSYLDTPELLAAAQVNKFVFQRVDELFALESKIAQSSWKVRETSFTEEEEEEEEEEKSTEKKDENDSTASTQPQQKNAVQNFFTSLASTITTQALAVGAGGVLEGVDPEMCLLPPAVLDLLRTKLNYAEVRAITNLNEIAEMKIKRVEEVCAEKEDIMQRLLNTETVRDFLITKLKSAEMALKSSLREGVQCKKQAAADGEVIHFLDLRNQELEGQCRESELQRQGLQAAYDLYQSTHAHNERNLTDELVSLKAVQLQSDLSHKSEKKLLVKEVKTLRGNLDKLTNERNLLASQVQAISGALRRDHSHPGKQHIGGRVRK